jgi:hypothetical protein
MKSGRRWPYRRSVMFGFGAAAEPLHRDEHRAGHEEHALRPAWNLEHAPALIKVSG